MLTAFLSPSLRSVSASYGRTSSHEDDHRVKLYKAASRSAHDEVERADAVLAERIAEERERVRARRDADLRDYPRR